MVPYAHLQFIKIVEKVVDARRDDDGVLEVRLGVTTKQMRPYTRFSLTRLRRRAAPHRSDTASICHRSALQLRQLLHAELPYQQLLHHDRK